MIREQDFCGRQVHGVIDDKRTDTKAEGNLSKGNGQGRVSRKGCQENFSDDTDQPDCADNKEYTFTLKQRQHRVGDDLAYSQRVRNMTNGQTRGGEDGHGKIDFTDIDRLAYVDPRNKEKQRN